MNAITLTRTEPARNMHRHRRLGVQPDLFGAWCCMRKWGRIGSAGQTCGVPYTTPREAQAALDRPRRKTERRGYTATGAGRH